MRLAPGQRHAILQEMGIQTYVPRIVLPGARPSPVWVAEPLRDTPPLSPLAAAESPRQPAPARVPPTMPVVGEVPTLSRSEPPEPGTTAPTQPIPAPVAVSPAAAAEAVNFAFAYVPVNEHLAVICELPWARSAVLSPSCRQLLADLLKAIGAPCEAERLSPMVFSWPLADAGEMPADAQTARHMLEGFLSRRLKLRAVPHLLILAEKTAEYLFPAASQPQAGELQRHPRLDVEVLVTHSLHAMEAVRELKRSAWQALQPLKQALATAVAPGQHPGV